MAKHLADKDTQVAQMKKQIEALVASHHAMIRIVGELGGMPKLIELFKQYDTFQRTLQEVGAFTDIND